MAEHGPIEPRGRAPRRRYQFGVATLLLLAIPVSLLAASLGGMLGQGGAGRIPSDWFILMCAATPLGLAVLAGLGHYALQSWKHHSRKP